MAAKKKDNEVGILLHQEGSYILEEKKTEGIV